MSYDNLTKILAEKYPDRFAAWLLGIPQTNVRRTVDAGRPRSR
jgi:predicted transposase YdaD